MSPRLSLFGPNVTVVNLFRSKRVNKFGTTEPSVELNNEEKPLMFGSSVKCEVVAPSMLKSMDTWSVPWISSAVMVMNELARKVAEFPPASAMRSFGLAVIESEVPSISKTGPGVKFIRMSKSNSIEELVDVEGDRRLMANPLEFMG